MERKINILFSFAILALSFPLLEGTHLSKSEIQKVIHLTNKETKFRFTRQLIIDPQPFLPLITNRVLQVPVPTNIAFFPGGGQPTDQCNREETLMEDGSCQNLLTPGNCGTQEEVLMDPQTNRGFCAPRICPPDRVFLPLTQLCHDPRDAAVCPPGRELYYSAYGTAVCTCPDGTVEGDDDLDDDVCEPVLGTTLQCSPGMYEHESMPVNYNQPTYTKLVDSQASLSSSYSVDLSDYYKPQVFWFKDFNSPPQCLPDPCNGTNLRRGPNDLPYVPNEHGKCFQLGQTEEACPYGKIYILNLEKVRGECESLEDAGYNIFDPKVLEALKKMFGPTITENTGAPFKETYGNVNQTIYGISSSYPHVQQSSNTIQPISSYHTSPIPNIQSINNNQNNQNSINSFINEFVSPPFDQTNNVGTQPSKQNHHQIVLGSNSFSSTKKTEILSAINLTNLLSSTHQGGQNFNAIFNYQTTLNPINHLNSLRLTNHQVNQRILIQKNNKQTFRHQDTQLSFSQSQKPFLQDTITQPFNHDNNVDVFSNVINSFTNNQGNKKIQSSARPLTSTSNSISNIKKPESIQGNNQGKEICTFVQNSNGQGGKKVCQFIDQQPLNSLEIPGQMGHNSPEMIPLGQIPSPSFEIFNGRGFESYGIRFGRSLGFKHPPEPGLLTHHVTVFPNGEVVAHKQPLSRHRRENEEINITKNTIVEVNNSETLNKVLSRRKRNLLPYASPSNVFETRLLSCRPGAARDINGKCRNKILPARIPQRRGTRAAPPVPPTPSCPGGMAFNIRRMCVPATTAQNSLVAFNLG